MMRSFVRLAVATAMAVAGLASTPAKTDAATLTLTDTFGGSNTIWTLDIATGCTTCAATLTAFFQDPDGGLPGLNAYTGQYLDSVQWVISGSTITTTGFVSTNATNATTTSWSFDEKTSVNANQCGGGAAKGTCGQTNNALGFGPIQNGSTLTWTFDTTFKAPLPTVLDSGDIRAAFNKPNGQNFAIFSPDSGTFGETGGGGTGGNETGGNVPEPASLTLFGLSALALARRVRRA